jgi:hypothetical protein
MPAPDRRFAARPLPRAPPWCTWTTCGRMAGVPTWSSPPVGKVATLDLGEGYLPVLPAPGGDQPQQPNDRSSGAFSVRSEHARRHVRRQLRAREKPWTLNVDCSAVLGKQTVPARLSGLHRGCRAARATRAPAFRPRRTDARLHDRGRGRRRGAPGQAAAGWLEPTRGTRHWMRASPPFTSADGTSPCSLPLVELSHSSLTPKAQSHSASHQNMCGAPTGAQARSGRHRLSS